MSDYVDVLGVMDERIQMAAPMSSDDLREARAAVEELIEATNAYLDGRKWYNPLYANKRQFDTFAAIESRLTASLVRVRGVA